MTANPPGQSELEFEVEEVRCDSCDYVFPAPGFVNEELLREELTHVCGGRFCYALTGESRPFVPWVKP